MRWLGSRHGPTRFLERLGDADAAVATERVLLLAQRSWPRVGSRAHQAWRGLLITDGDLLKHDDARLAFGQLRKVFEDAPFADTSIAPDLDIAAFVQRRVDGRPGAWSRVQGNLTNSRWLGAGIWFCATPPLSGQIWQENRAIRYGGNR